MIASAVMLLAMFSTSSATAENPQEHSAVIGAWKDTFEGNALAVFLPDGTALFTFLKPVQREDWHLLGKWRELKPGQIEVVFPSRPPAPGEPGDHQTDVFVIDSASPDYLRSPHGGGMIRVAPSTDKTDKTK
ncbi:MAG: hypothetical protein JWR15_2457 [Prosthecobacter sp.]|nr:hypothetical protein [Prosthecobacter sp.]